MLCIFEDTYFNTNELCHNLIQLLFLLRNNTITLYNTTPFAG